MSNADGSQVQLFGNAVITRDPCASAMASCCHACNSRAKFLHAWTRDERVRSHPPVVLLRGKSATASPPTAWTTTTSTSSSQLRGRVHGVLQPPAR